MSRLRTVGIVVAAVAGTGVLAVVGAWVWVEMRIGGIYFGRRSCRHDGHGSRDGRDCRNPTW